MAEISFDEATVVESLGMKYVTIPIRPGTDAIRVYHPATGFVRVPCGPGTSKPRYLIHDAAGDRAGAVWVVYVAKRYNRDADAAIKAGRKACLHSQVMIDDVRRALEPSSMN